MCSLQRIPGMIWPKWGKLFENHLEARRNAGACAAGACHLRHAGSAQTVFTAAWTGIVCTHPAMTYVSVRPQRYSHSLIEQNGSYVVNLTTAQLVCAADFCGVRSGGMLINSRRAG